MRALLVIDMQNDFLPEGALAVPKSFEILPVVNELIDNFSLVVATQDWHPRNHISFASNHKNEAEFNSIEIDGKSQTLWPDHCVQNSFGAEFHQQIKSEQFETIFRKGTDANIDSYSGFYDNHHLKSTGLTGYLWEKKVQQIHVCGLAADYCVYFSIKDALQEGFKVILHENATKPIDEQQYEQRKIELLAHSNFSIQ